MEIDRIVSSCASMLPAELRCGSEDDLAELPPHEDDEAGWGARGWEVFRDIDY